MAGNYVLYEHRNKVNGKRYIGVTNNTAKRWCANGNRYERCPHFWAAIQKYGWDNFEHNILIYDLTREEASRLEIYYIAKYRTREKAFGYNVTEGGVNPPSMLGKHHSEETKQKIRNSNRGKRHSEEQNRKHSEHMTGLMVGSRNRKSRAVRCITTGEVFETQREAAIAKNVLQSKISLCCQGKRTHTHGLRWEFAEVN